jgi:signal transduction histidine kinase
MASPAWNADTVTRQGLFAWDRWSRLTPFLIQVKNSLRQMGKVELNSAMVRELAQAHGGNVVARSDGHDLGSEFVVTLPVAMDESLPA